jgi:hypothetical protein
MTKRSGGAGAVVVSARSVAAMRWLNPRVDVHGVVELEQALFVVRASEERCQHCSREDGQDAPGRDHPGDACYDAVRVHKFSIAPDRLRFRSQEMHSVVTSGCTGLDFALRR